MAGSAYFIYINGSSSPINASGADNFEVTQVGLSLKGTAQWTYSGTETFKGFASSQGATSPLAGLEVGKTLTVDEVSALLGYSDSIYIYSVEGVANRTVSLENLYEFKQKIDETVKYKALYNLSTYDSVDASDPDYDVITRNGWKRNVSKWILEHADELNFRDTTNGHEIGRDGGNGVFPSAFVGNGSLMTAVCNQLFQFGTDDSAWANVSEYWLNPNWISLPNTYSTKASYLDFFSTHEIIVDYKLNFSYQETVIKNKPISQLDQDGESWVKSEYEKTLNLIHGAFTNGQAYSGTGGTYGDENAKCIRFKIEPNTTYALNNGSYIWVNEYNSAGTFLRQKTAPGTFTTSSDCAYVGLTYPIDANAMLNYGSTALPYQQYNGRLMHTIDVQGALLWQNGNPNTQFSPNAVSLPTLPEYSRILFAFKLNNDSNYAAQTLLVFKEVGKYAFLACIGSGGDRWERTAFVETSTTIRFMVGKTDDTENNWSCIPLAIYGIK